MELKSKIWLLLIRDLQDQRENNLFKTAGNINTFLASYAINPNKTEFHEPTESVKKTSISECFGFKMKTFSLDEQKSVSHILY
jgi:hypothetical protein